MENNTAMSIMNAEMEALMEDYNEVMLDFAEASMIEDNYTEKYEKRDKCRLVKVQIAPTFAGSFDYGYTSTGFKYVKHMHSESSYQYAWCSMHNGVEEYENTDKTRVDCLTKTHAVEFDFANKWAESIGQALHYQKMTGKRAKVVLILEKPKKQMIYYKRVAELGKLHNFDVEYVTPEILQLKNDKCPYMDCKCNKKHEKSNTKKY